MLTPIAHWDAIPGQRRGRIGVMAFHRDGIREVVFSGPMGVQGVSATTLNPDTGVQEFVHRARKPGRYTATVYANDGGIRVLPEIDIAPENTIMIRVEPGQSIRAALKTAAPSSGVVRLMPGFHVWDGDPAHKEHIACTGWVTIEGDGLATIDRVTGGAIACNCIKLSRLTIKAPNLVQCKAGATCNVWVAGANLVCSGKDHPIGANVSALWLTDCTISGAWRATGLCQSVRMMRGVTIVANREDVVQNPQGPVVNCTVQGIDPGSSGDHADCVQFWGAPQENVLIYGLDARGMKYQGLFWRSPGVSRNCAIIGSRLEMAGPLSLRGACGNTLAGEFDHLLIRGVDFTGTKPADLNVSSDFNLWSEGGKFAMTNCEISECRIGSHNFGRLAVPADAFKRNRWAGGAPIDGLPQ